MSVKTVREAIISGLARYSDCVFDEADVAELEAKVEAAATPTDKLGYAHVVGRNWAISQHRRRQGVLGAQADRTAKLLKEERRRQEEAEFEAARVEFWPTATRVIESTLPRYREGQVRQMTVVWLTVFEQQTTRQISTGFPGVSEASLWQWCRRGRKCLLRIATDRLKKAIAQGMWHQG